MGFNFKKFTEVAASFDARVTIRQRTGQLGFNAGAINRFHVNRYRHAVLYFDSSQRVVGVELTNEKCEGAIDIKCSPSNTFIRAKSFLDRFSIGYHESRRYKLEKDEDSGLLYFALEETGEDKEDSVSEEKPEDMEDDVF